MTRVTVVIPVYNGEPFITRAVASVLEQTLADFELVVLDNGSTDATPRLLDAFDDPRLRVVRFDETVDVISNWNRALDQASAPYFKLVCADDLLHPTCLERQVAVLEHPANAAVGMVAARRTIIDPDGAVLLRSRGLPGLVGRVPGAQAIRQVVRSGTNPIGEACAVLLRTEVIARTGRWDGTQPYLTDLDYWTRVLESHDLYGIGEPLAGFRVQLGSWSTAIGRAQSAQYHAFVTRLAARSEVPLSRADLAVSHVRAEAAALARAGVYRWLARRPGGPREVTPRWSTPRWSAARTSSRAVRPGTARAAPTAGRPGRRARGR